MICEKILNIASIRDKIPDSELSIDLFGVHLGDFSQNVLIARILSYCNSDIKRRVFYVNLYCLNLIWYCSKLRELFSRADLVYCDGFGLKLLLRMKGIKISYRNTPPDWLDSLLDELTKHQKRLFLIGDEQDAVEKTAAKMSARHPGLQVSGTQHGFFQKHGRENESVIKKINDAAPDILIVGMGMPMQEFWISENMNDICAKVYFTVGAAFRYYSGVEKRAPRWMTDNGLEWLGRLMMHPVKHFRRYIIGIPQIFFRFLKSEILHLSLYSGCEKKSDCRFLY